MPDPRSAPSVEQVTVYLSPLNQTPALGTTERDKFVIRMSSAGQASEAIMIAVERMGDVASVHYYDGRHDQCVVYLKHSRGGRTDQSAWLNIGRQLMLLDCVARVERER